jgi:hypothetical protein
MTLRTLAFPLVCVCVAWLAVAPLAMPTSARAQDTPERGVRADTVSTWGDSTAVLLVAHASARRQRQLADSTLRDYSASARGFLAFLAQFGDGFVDAPRVVQSEQLALRLAWWQPGRSAQQLVGRRDTSLLPSDVGYYRDRYGVVLDNLPDRIRLGDGYDVADVPHPLASGADTLYEYRIGEEFRMRLPDREVPVSEVQFRPRNATAPRAIGSVYLDRESHAVVRLSMTFTRAAILDRRIETLVITLENSLVVGRYWLPRRQEVEVARRSTWLDVPARGIVRGHWDISNYRVNEGVEAGMESLPSWSSVSRSALRSYSFDGEVVDALPPHMQVARPEEVRDAQLRAEAAVRAAALGRPLTVAAAGRGISDVIRHNRAEGLAVGVGLSRRWSNAIGVHSRVRYGVEDRQWKGRVSIEKRPPLGGAPLLALFAERQYRMLGVEERSGVVNSLASVLFGSDYQSPVDVRAIGLHGAFGRGQRWEVRVAWEQEDSVPLTARPLSGRYGATLPATALHGVRMEASRRHSFGEPNASHGNWTVRVIGHIAERTMHALDVQDAADLAFTNSASLQADLPAQLQAVRLETMARRVWVRENERQLVLTGHAGITVGSGVRQQLPAQWLQFAGGTVSGPGYGFHAFAGAFVAHGRAEWRVPVPFVAVPLGKYGETPRRATLAPYVHAVLVGGSARDHASAYARPITAAVDGVYPTIGISTVLFYDLLRVDVARGLRDGRWRFGLDVDRSFWGIL